MGHATPQTTVDNAATGTGTGTGTGHRCHRYRHTAINKAPLRMCHETPETPLIRRRHLKQLRNKHHS